jgi:hypothetical protein
VKEGLRLRNPGIACVLFPRISTQGWIRVD